MNKGIKVRNKAGFVTFLKTCIKHACFRLILIKVLNLVAAVVFA